MHLGHGVPPQDVRTGARRSRGRCRSLRRASTWRWSIRASARAAGGRGADAGRRPRRAGQRPAGPGGGALRRDREAVEISASPWRLEPVSATFHGRDVFGPVAAHLALGESRTGRASIGSASSSGSRAARPAGNVHVVEVDGFGNLITDAALPSSRRAHRRARGGRGPHVRRRPARRAGHLRGLRGRRRGGGQRRQCRRAARRVGGGVNWSWHDAWVSRASTTRRSARPTSARASWPRRAPRTGRS